MIVRIALPSLTHPTPLIGERCSRGNFHDQPLVVCEEVHLNLAYRWFCRLGLEGAVPDHSAFSKNRHGRFRDSDLLRELFEITVRRCIEEGLVGGEGFAVDASLIKADANKPRSAAASEQVDWEVSPRAAVRSGNISTRSKRPPGAQPAR